MTEREIFRSECQIENLKGVIKAATDTVAAARHALELETERLNRGREDRIGAVAVGGDVWGPAGRPTGRGALMRCHPDDAAFPIAVTEDDEHTPRGVPRLVTDARGLTKRELFAALALSGMCAMGDPSADWNHQALARDAVAAADALIAALDATP